MTVTIPKPEPKKFVEAIEQEYSNDRYSEVYQGSHKTPESVTVVSGDTPAFSRFIRDIKPYLYHHGFVVSATKKNHKTYLNKVGNNKGYHQIRGISLQWVIAESQGYTCNRGACTRLADPDDGWYCEHCIPQHGSHRTEQEERTIFP